jgi:colicin import membrane protein
VISAFLGIVSILGFFVCIIMVIVSAIKKSEKTRNWGIGIIACCVLFIVAVSIPSGDSASTSSNTAKTPEQIEQAKVETEENAEAEAEAKAAKEKEEVVAEPEEKTTETLSQKNAVKKAEDYINIMAFSRSGLIEQLEFEGFSNEDATYAVDQVSVDWREQAVKKAEEYLNMMAFSRSGLIEQLEFEGFSKEDATYAVDTIGF